MPRQTLMYALCALIAVGAGAAGSWLSRAKAGVAVVDLDKVAKELGRVDMMENDLRSAQNTLANQLAGVQKQAIEKLNEMKSGLGETPAEEDLKKFNATAQATQIQFNNLQRQAVAKIGERRDILVFSFRQEARPVVEKIAKSKGAATVITKNEAFTFDNTVDITEDVINEMKANPAKAPAAKPAPAAPAAASGTQVRQASATTTRPAPAAARPAPAAGTEAAPARRAEK